MFAAPDPTRDTLPWLLSSLLVLLPLGTLEADQAKVLDQLKRSEQEFSTKQTWAARQAELREQFLRGARLWPLPSRPPVEAIVHSRREFSGYSVENVALETLPGFYCTGNLYRPVGRKQSHAIVLCPHGHFRPDGRLRESQQIRCAHLARMGATVFSYSMVGWQDSQQTTHDDPLVLALQTWNSIRAVDFLSSLDRVDPTRIGVAGASGGGTQSLYLALADERVRAVAPLVIVYPWAAPQGCNCEGGMPVMQAADTNMIELAAAIAPRPQLLISVGNDPTEDFPQVGFPFIQRMYSLAGAAQAVRNIHLANEPHDFGPTKRREVYEFLSRELKIEDDGFSARAAVGPVEDLSEIKIEAPEQLVVFDEAHPLPAQAVRGSAAIAAAFDGYLQQLRAADEARDKVPVKTVQDGVPANYSFEPAGPKDELLMFTPSGFTRPGDVARDTGPRPARLRIRVIDNETGEPTYCRVNVVGPDGDFYEPREHRLRDYSLTGVWPKSGWGNRQGKAPIRYFGRFFYSPGESTVKLPAGTSRVEVWKGFEYRPEKMIVRLRPDENREIQLRLRRTSDMRGAGYWSGDPHIHIPRRTEEDEADILGLMKAEGIHYGTILAYNDPAGKYRGEMVAMDAPQFRGLGYRSVVRDGQYSMISGEEYRSSTYGHLNLFGLDRLAMPGLDVNTNNWPPYGHVVREAREEGGIAFYAHGGYAQSIYADVAQGLVDGVELLQFGVYRGIGLIDWYHMLNSGFRVPASGACDYPACRKLGDCKTYVATAERQPTTPPTMKQWLTGMQQGRSFFTSGPLILLEVDGRGPGAQINAVGPREVTIRARVRCDVAPVTDLQLIANGKVVESLQVPSSEGIHSWIELSTTLRLERSAWIAARAFSLSKNGTPDAEAHTNPVYIYIDGKAPYERQSLDAIVTAVDRQLSLHKKRAFPERAKVVAYFERSRDILMNIRAAGGALSEGHPAETVSRAGEIEDPGRRDHTDEELRAFLRPLPPKPIEEVLQSFDMLPGFKIELVAREPLVHDPIAAAFDEDGNLYVCEMRDYPYKPPEGQSPIGTLRLLRDTDGDGVFDESHVFADNLLWAGGVAPWKGGVFVAAPPDIWYMKDTDGDHRADIRRKIVTGFGTANQQAMLNNLTWGLDHKIYGSTAHNGGTIQYAEGVNQSGFPEPISVAGRDFRLDPITLQFEAISGTVQFGNTFDDWGNRFLCSESRPLLTAVLPQRYLARNPFLPVSSTVHSITKGVVPIYRISPLERWRMIRSSRRVASGARSPDSAGASHHVLDAAAGVTVYRGGTYPPEFYGNVFIGGAQNNVVHRRELRTDGVTFTSRRVDEGTEFARSSDNWFRPVNFVNAPDGTLYVLDMSREILETIHVPLDVVKFLDFTSGRQHGRIYRMAPAGFSYPGPPRLGSATTTELVTALSSPHGWWRDTAHRLIYERQDKTALPALRELLRRGAAPQSRLHALWSLHGLSQLTDDDLLIALSDRDARVREHALRLSESRLDQNPALLAKALRFSRDPNQRLRFQAAFSLGESDSQQAAQALVEMSRHDSDNHWIRTAILSSAGQLADRMLISLLTREQLDDPALVDQLAMIVGSRNRPAEVSAVLAACSEQPSSRAALVDRLIIKMATATRRSGVQMRREVDPRVDQMLERMFSKARNNLQNPNSSPGTQELALQLLACADYESHRELIMTGLQPQRTESVQLTAISALAGYRQPTVADDLLLNWPSYSPEVRLAAGDALLSRTAWTKRLLQSAAAGDVSVAWMDSNRRQLLLTHRDPVVRQLAAAVFDNVSSDRGKVVRRYMAALELTGDAGEGSHIFRDNCAACHRVKGQGHAVGPDLNSAGEKDAAALLAHILDPNQYVLPNFETYVLIDSNGRTLSGMIAAQTGNSVTLRKEKEVTETVLRGDVDELISTGKSFMPEGFEQKIDVRQMADLLTFLREQTTQPQDPAALPIGTLPGLVEPTDKKEKAKDDEE